MTHSSFSNTASRRAQLQRAAGELGEVLERVARGAGEFPAAGWYIRIGEETLYLGDHVGVAFVSIARLQEPDDE